MSSEHLNYLREVLEHDAIGFGEYDQLPAAIEHFEALEHASEQYRKAMSDQAKRIEQLEAALRRIAQHDLQAIAIDALRRIAQHDLQAIAIDALRPGERVPLEVKDD